MNKKKTLRTLFLLLLLTAFSVSNMGYAQWIQVKELESAYSALVTPGGALLLSDFRPDKQGGIYRSEDQGSTWTKTCSEDHRYSQFLQMDGYIFASGEGTYIARSADDGKTWEVLSYADAVKDALGDYTSYAVCYAMAVHNGKLFAGDFSGGGIVYSEDYGNTWKTTDLASLQYTYSDSDYALLGTAPQIPRQCNVAPLAKGDTGGKSDLVTENIYQLASFNGHLYACGIYFVFELDESTLKWNVIRDDSNFMAVSTTFNDRLLMARSVMNDTFSVPFILTLDKSGAWGEVPRPEGLRDNNIRSLSSDDKNIYAGLQLGGIYYTPNEGIQWFNISEGIPEQTNSANGSSYYLSPLALRPADDCIYCVIYNTPGSEGSGLYKFDRSSLPTTEGIVPVGGSEPRLSLSADGNSLALSGSQQPAHVEVWNANGRKVADRVIAPGETVATGAPGAYVFRILSGSQQTTGKVVIR